MSNPTRAPTADGPVSADIFLALTTQRAGFVKGESQAEGHLDAIMIESWSWGVSSPSDVEYSRVTRPRSYKHLVVRKLLDRSTVSLLRILTGNDNIKEARLSMRKAGGNQRDYFTITLSDARLTAIDIECDAQGQAREVVSISFNKVQIDYEMQSATGQRAAGSSFADEILQQ